MVARLPCHTLETDSFLSGTSGCGVTYTINATIMQREPAGTNAFETFKMPCVMLMWLWDKTSSLIYHGYGSVGLFTMVRSTIRWWLNMFYRKRSVGLLDLLLLQKSMTLPKEKDLVAPYLKEGKTFYDIPWEIVDEYGHS